MFAGYIFCWSVLFYVVTLGKSFGMIVLLGSNSPVDLGDKINIPPLPTVIVWIFAGIGIYSH